MPTYKPADEAVAISAREFSHRYGISRSRAYELVAAGEIDAVRAGDRILILAESAERWFRSLPPYEGPIERPGRVVAGA
jgi:excisionase family DNA binding protein